MKLLSLPALVLAISCGSKQPAPAQPTSEPATAETAPVTETTVAMPDDPSCPPREQQTAAIGTPCPTEGASCGHAEAAAATGLSNVLSCTAGVWKNFEVPPPAPAP